MVFIPLLFACSSEEELEETEDEEYVEEDSGSSDDGSDDGDSGDDGSSDDTDDDYEDDADYSDVDDDLYTFTIAVDSTAFSESETVPSDDEDYLENNEFSSEITITYSGTSASYSGSVSGVSVSISGADVTVTSTVKKVCYKVSGGTTDGFLKIYSDYKFELDLNGVNITNPDGAAINIQSSKRCFVVLGEGTYNTLTDGTSYSDETSSEDMKATFFSEGELLFSGSGSLKVYANCKAGIRSDDYILFRPGINVYVKATAGNAIKGNDAIYLRGGVINAEVSATASKGLSSDGHIYIEGGRTTLITTGGGEYDSSERDVTACAGVKADSTFTITSGRLYCKSTGKGGKGISCDMQLYIKGGLVRIITTGTQYTYGNYDTSPKGIKSDGAMYISGGNVMVRATGGDGSEGIESKSTMSISGGTIQAYCYDDAINTTSNLTISDGKIFAYGTHNDGIDSNSNLYIKGGTVIACGTDTPEGGLDSDEGTFAVTGGTIVAIGGDNTSPSTSSTTQPCLIAKGSSSVSNGTYFTFDDSSGNNLITFTPPTTYSSYSLFLSCPDMSKGSSYTLSTGATVTGGDDFNGYVTDATISGGSSVASVTLSSMVTTTTASSGSSGGGSGGSGGSGNTGNQPGSGNQGGRR